MAGLRTAVAAHPLVAARPTAGLAQSPICTPPPATVAARPCATHSTAGREPKLRRARSLPGGPWQDWQPP
eukprot:11357149-Alexandrium_andersonii.AAC.1